MSQKKKKKWKKYKFFWEKTRSQPAGPDSPPSDIRSHHQPVLTGRERYCLGFSFQSFPSFPFSIPVFLFSISLSIFFPPLFFYLALLLSSLLPPFSSSFGFTPSLTLSPIKSPPLSLTHTDTRTPLVSQSDIISPSHSIPSHHLTSIAFTSLPTPRFRPSRHRINRITNTPVLHPIFSTTTTNTKFTFLTRLSHPNRLPNLSLAAPSLDHAGRRTEAGESERDVFAGECVGVVLTHFAFFLGCDKLTYGWVRTGNKAGRYGG